MPLSDKEREGFLRTTNGLWEDEYKLLKFIHEHLCENPNDNHGAYNSIINTDTYGVHPQRVDATLQDLNNKGCLNVDKGEKTVSITEKGINKIS